MNTKEIVHGYKLREAEPSLLEDSGAGIAVYRKGMGLTQAELGALTGMDKTHISKLEGTCNPTVGTLKRIYEAMGARIRVTIDESADVEPSIYMDDLVLEVFDFAADNGLTPRQAFNYLYRFGGIDFYLKDPLLEMELSSADTLDAMASVCRNNGGAL